MLLNRIIVRGIRT